MIHWGTPFQWSEEGLLFVIRWEALLPLMQVLSVSWTTCGASTVTPSVSKYWRNHAMI